MLYYDFVGKTDLPVTAGKKGLRNLHSDLQRANLQTFAPGVPSAAIPDLCKGSVQNPLLLTTLYSLDLVINSTKGI